MHPAFSIIFLTTLIGAGQGLFLALYTGQLYSVFKLLPAESSGQFYVLGSLISLALLVAGLGSSFFHLGRPERAWRSAARWRTSWMSREVIVLPVFMASVAAWGLLHFTGWNPVLFTLGDSFPVDLSLLAGAVATVLCFALFLCTGMIYACIKMLQEWATPWTVINYTLLGWASGFTLVTGFAAYQESAQTGFFGAWAIILTVLALIGRSASLVRNASLQPKSTMETAIGVRHSRIEQKAQGAMGGSFNTREYFHGASQRKYKNIKWLFLLLVFPVPLVMLAGGLVAASPALLVLAFLVQYAGLVLERWFFFAQANHPQNLYYQTV
ncbi:MAG: dimethyl sulfoxide reductase anchor subunit [Xanthomonadales bacterium]|nr:dimethyl sulfoxide reductase anchor subunit [Gammaproteobacteria bacterium]MBT8074208.1 dimethyl sulfoxide reductase anchor subunit [Gammaproteobacteria bacterium]NNK05060.1 dimethyl sulfoxide reductase anchor subunit [Xanthomonadales bacterium]NNK99378.1 dimethyl sulfoxide reductase anchor subunit [Xanthomonadales bacterium]